MHLISCLLPGRYFFFLTWLLLFIPLFKAEVNPVIPAWVKPLNISDVPPVNKKQIKDGYYYLLADEQYNNIYRHNYFHYALCAVTEQGLAGVSQIEVEYDPSYQKAAIHKVVVYRAGRVIDRTREINLQILNEEKERRSGILNGKHTLYANLSDIRKGDTIEYSYSKTGENPVLGSHYNYAFSVSYSVPVGRLFRRILLAKGSQPNIVYQQTQLLPEVIETNVTEYSWKIDNPAVIYTESSVPSWYSAQGQIQLSNFNSWEEVKQHCISLFKSPDYNDRELNVIADSISRSSSDTESQITAAVDFVQTHVRYSGNENGIYSHVPRTPDIILRNRYGDCKEKSVLLVALLKKLGVSAFPVLVNTDLGERVKEQVPSINAFNHAIIVISYNNELFFVDPTFSSQRGSFRLRRTPHYETGLALSEGLPVFLNIPVNGLSATQANETFVITQSGDCRLYVKSVYTGNSADDNRYRFLTSSIDDIQESYRKFYTRFNEQIYVLDTLRTEDNEENNEFIVYESYMLPGFWKSEESSTSKSISKGFMPLSLHSLLDYGESATRKDPLSIHYPMAYSQTINIQMEGGWNISESVTKENNKFFEYSYSKQVNGDRLSLIYDYKAHTGVIMPEEYTLYREKMDFINHNIVFNATYQENASGFNWPLALAILIGLSGGGLLVWKLYHRPVTYLYPQEYSSIGGWLIVAGIGITLTPLSLIFGMIREYHSEMNINYLSFFFGETSPYFSPLRGYYNLTLPLLNSFFLAFSILILVLFYRRRADFRKTFVLFHIANTVFVILNVITLYSIVGDSTDVNERSSLLKETNSMVRSIIGTIIWVPYIWYSQRSRHTFTRSDQSMLSGPTSTSIEVLPEEARKDEGVTEEKR